MSQSPTQKEELFTLLTEIYDELEELERAFDTNLNDYRNRLIEEQAKKIAACELRIDKLEENFIQNPIGRKEQQKIIAPTNPKMKLTLGF